MIELQRRAMIELQRRAMIELQRRAMIVIDRNLPKTVNALYADCYCYLVYHYSCNI
jgi:hypothetical protein